MPRVITLIASATEIVCALGLEKYLVGRSHECDYPPSVAAVAGVYWATLQCAWQQP